MPIPPELQEYEGEADFRDRFVIRLLHRLGFATVVNYHGAREFGKDVVFGGVDRFGHFVYGAVQVKFVDRIGEGQAADEMARDARQALEHEFVHPHTGQSDRVSRFYGMNAGTISENASKDIFTHLAVAHSNNVVLLDGHALLRLDRRAAYDRGVFVREQLSGLLLELRTNDGNLANIQAELPEYAAGRGGCPAYRCRDYAVLGYLQRPLALGDLSPDTVQSYWQLVQMVNRIVDSVDSVIGGDWKLLRANQACHLAGEARALSAHLQEIVAAALGDIEPPTPL